MNYVSTRDNSKKVASAQAIAAGIAPDGGLYTPVSLPKLDEKTLADLTARPYAERAATILSMFLSDFTYEELLEYSHKAYSAEKFRYADGYKTDVPLDGVALKKLNETEYVLELFRGPTCAFKDMALQMLPHLLTASLRKTGETRRACILVATSGDTGKAALEGFKDVDGTAITVFYPVDGVSDVQKLQMITQEGNNVGVCAVRGNFDDAQTGVKKIFGDAEVRANLDAKGDFLSSANSINWGRLAPQVVYYVSAYCDMVARGEVKMGDKVNFCVPTGNFGNILAAYIAKQMGLPVGKLLCASNSNNVLTDFLTDGVYDRQRHFYQTLSPSMDILISSNVERLLYYISGGDDKFVAAKMAALSSEGKYTLEGETLDLVRSDFYGAFCDDAETKKTIKAIFDETGYLIDTHTAVAVSIARRYRAETGDMTKCVVASTASAFKFAKGVYEALGGETEGLGDVELLNRLAELTGEPIPAPLADIEKRQRRFERVADKSEMTDAVYDLLAR